MTHSWEISSNPLMLWRKYKKSGGDGKIFSNFIGCFVSFRSWNYKPVSLRGYGGIMFHHVWNDLGMKDRQRRELWTMKRDGRRKGESVNDEKRERLRKIGACSSVHRGLGSHGNSFPRRELRARGRLCVRTRRAVRPRGAEVGQGRRAPWRHSEPWNRQTLLFIHGLSSHSSSFLLFFLRSHSSLTKITRRAENPLPPVTVLLSYRRSAFDDSSDSKASAALKTTSTDTHK